jgi:sigma-B regulation protein RsbU (phosphoserine phosphatase)
VLFTDGVVEAANADGEEFGPDRLLEVLKRTSGATVQKMIRAVVRETRAHSRRHGYHDDFTIVILRRRLSPQPAA